MVVLRPGPLFYDEPAFRATTNRRWLDAGTYPSGAVWADDSDATYWDVASYVLPGNQQRTLTGSADFPRLGTGLVSLTLEWRFVTVPSSAGGGYQQTVAIADAETGEELDGSSGPPGTLSPTWVSYNLSGPNYYDGRIVRITPWDSSASTDSPEPKFRVFEARLIAEYAAPATIRRRAVRPLRQHPRDDGLGMSSAPRVDANRSQQRSLRVAGGTYT